MELLNSFANAFLLYSKDLFFPVVIGFLISGFLYEFIPSEIVEKYLGQKGIKPIFFSTLIGTALPICCFGTLPIAVTLRQKGARLGPVLAFLVTTPATSVSALMACWKLLGPTFAIYIFFAVIVMGLIIGVLGNLLPLSAPKVGENITGSCCSTKNKSGKNKDFFSKFESVLTYAFITLPKEIGLELILGIAVASFIMVFEPVQVIIRQYLNGAGGYLFSLIVGLTTEVCSTASVPMTDAFIRSGMLPGAAMVYLLGGPITSYGVIFATYKEFGGKIVAFYLVSISVLSLAFGILFNIFFVHAY